MARPAASQAPGPLPFSRPQRAQVLRTPLPPAPPLAGPHCRPPSAPPSPRGRREWPHVHRLRGPSSHGLSSGAESTCRPVHPVTIGRGGHHQLYRGTEDVQQDLKYLFQRGPFGWYKSRLISADSIMFCERE